MKNFKRLSTVAVTGLIAVAFAASVVCQAYAWHPQGLIVKSVQNVTTGSALSDANTANTAVSAKPGDVLKYVIVVSNTGDADKSGNNDMAQTVMGDILPAGVEMVSSPSQRTITENIGTIKPGKIVTKEYTVRVIATKDGLIENRACFAGDSTANDNPQKGCDMANIKVTVPVVVTPPVTPITPVKVVTPAPVTADTAVAPVTPANVDTPAAPAALPKTGADSFLMIGSFATIAGYALNVMRLKFRTNQ